MEKPKHDLQLEIAESLETSPEFLPVIAQLLEDLWALGGIPEVLVSLLKGVAPKESIKSILDLGCGKGANGIAMAAAFGCRVAGIDAFGPFIEEASRRADQAGVGNLCRFRVGDMRGSLAGPPTYDAVLFVALGGLLGGFDRTVEQIRSVVRPGGFIVIDDGFLPDGAPIQMDGYEHYRDRDQTYALLHSHGDEIVAEYQYKSEETEALNQKNNASILKRATILSRSQPQWADDIERYCQRQKLECETIENQMISAAWVLRRK